MPAGGNVKAALVYPHQLFTSHPATLRCDDVYLVEDPLFFSQYHFHAQKLILHRASMRHYADTLREKGKKVHYIEAEDVESTSSITKVLRKNKVQEAVVVDPSDDWLLKRLTSACHSSSIQLTVLDDPDFLTPRSEFAQFVTESEAKKPGQGRNNVLFFTNFYIRQRKRLGILLDDQGKPIGGQWSYDAENRKKLPKDAQVPSIPWPKPNEYVKEATDYVRKNFPKAVGKLEPFVYPTDRPTALKLLKDFLKHRFTQFGEYEDAIDSSETFLFHSVLTPALNIGLLSPAEIVEATLEYQETVPLNSLEGFIRQVIGWREYMRGVYHHRGVKQRTTNYWGHTRPMPQSFYDGSSGITPVDTTIQRVLDHAFCHHIERLMILGNFMLLCEIDPDAIYQWFMELFIDAYDWVMVPNVYGMSQHADGGTITTKPYISGSSYVLKMSNYKKGEWCPVWDALYWRFIDKHRDFFEANPRMSVMTSQLDKMGAKLKLHHEVAKKFLSGLR